jgi:hypothetical protein
MNLEIDNFDTKQILQGKILELKNEGFPIIQLAHFGGLNQDLVNGLTLNVEDKMISSGDFKQVVKRVFSILIEGLQNILIHGERHDDEQLALVIVASNDTHYRIVLGNIARNMDQEKLMLYLDRINAMEEDEVKKFYLESLNNGLMSNKGGAGLGFITMRMKANSQLIPTFKKWGENQLFFAIQTDLKRSEG